MTMSVLDLMEYVKLGREPVLRGRKALQATELISATYEPSRRRAKVTLQVYVEDPALLGYNPMIGISNKIFHIVKCRTARCSGDFDRNEVKTVSWCPVDEIWRMIGEKKIKDGLSFTALLPYLKEARYLPKFAVLASPLPSAHTPVKTGLAPSGLRRFGQTHLRHRVAGPLMIGRWMTRFFPTIGFPVATQRGNIR